MAAHGVEIATKPFIRIIPRLIEGTRCGPGQPSASPAAKRMGSETCRGSTSKSATSSTSCSACSRKTGFGYSGRPSSGRPYTWAEPVERILATEGRKIRTLAVMGMVSCPFRRARRHGILRGNSWEPGRVPIFRKRAEISQSLIEVENQEGPAALSNDHLIRVKSLFDAEHSDENEIHWRLPNRRAVAAGKIR